MATKDKRAEGEAAIQASIEAMMGSDKELGKKLHPIIAANAPSLMPKTWYGMPAYANQDGKIICFFRPAQRFGDRFMTLGFNDVAHLDEGEMWPLSYAVKELTPAVEKQIAELVKKAAN
ncbi:MAG TPA: hypothetical protein VJ843_02115 [Candidatus Saccharimonadales bacterium]|nr:hypothetical protein [Candidatus Saccharimonadales bacterium]